MAGLDRPIHHELLAGRGVAPDFMIAFARTDKVTPRLLEQFFKKGCVVFHSDHARAFGARRFQAERNLSFQGIAIRL